MADRRNEEKYKKGIEKGEHDSEKGKTFNMIFMKRSVYYVYSSPYNIRT